MPTPARQHLDRTLHNPFPGIAALQRTLGRPIISRLSGNEALALYPGKWLRTYREDFLTRCREYPDPSAYSLCHAIARNMRVGLEEVLVDAGADSLIHLTLRAFTNTGDKVLSSTGTYPTFEYFAHSLGLQLCDIPYAGCGIGLHTDLPGLLAAAWDVRPKVVYLANPDNPTGHCHTQDALTAFAQALPEETLLLLDEAYLDFAPEEAGARQVWPNTVRLRSFSKAYGLAGLRVGYALAPAALLAYALQSRVHYSVSHPAQWLAEQALEDPEHGPQLREETLRLRARFITQARQAGLACIPSATNFVSLVMSSAQAANVLQWNLLQLGVSVSKPAAINHHSLIRITLQPDIFVPQIARLVFAPPGMRCP